MCRHENATQPDIEVSRKESRRKKRKHNGTGVVLFQLLKIINNYNHFYCRYIVFVVVRLRFFHRSAPLSFGFVCFEIR